MGFRGGLISLPRRTAKRHIGIFCAGVLGVLYTSPGSAEFKLAETMDWAAQESSGAVPTPPRFRELYVVETRSLTFGYVVSPTATPGVIVSKGEKGLWNIKSYLASGIVQTHEANASYRQRRELSGNQTGSFPATIGSRWYGSGSGAWTGNNATRSEGNLHFDYLVTARLDKYERIPDLPGPFYVVRSAVDEDFAIVWSEYLQWPVERVGYGSSWMALGGIGSKGRFGQSRSATFARAKSAQGVSRSWALAPSYYRPVLDAAARRVAAEQVTANQLGVFAQLLQHRWKRFNPTTGAVSDYSYRYVGGGTIQTQYGSYHVDGRGGGDVCTVRGGEEECSSDLKYTATEYYVMPKDGGPISRLKFYPEGLLVASGIYTYPAGEKFTHVDITQEAYMEPELRTIAQQAAGKSVEFWAEHERQIQERMHSGDAAAAQQRAKDNAEKAKTWAPALDALRSFNEGLGQ